MIDVDLCFEPARKLSALIRDRTLSAAELIEAVIARAQRVHKIVNCFETTFFEEARADARRADEELARGSLRGPLHGIPITLKDNVASAGHRLTNGSNATLDNVAATDAVVWARLKSAGAILTGKTTTPEFLHKVLTDSLPFGITRNPWSLERTPGGSSGGSAAALAAGAAPLTVGSDGGGSIRCPASCCGVFGLKPTLGRLPAENYPDTFGRLSSFCPMTRDVRDAALLLALMSGPAQADAHSLEIPPLSGEIVVEPEIKDLRIGFCPTPGTAKVDEDVAQLVSAAAGKLADAGALVDVLEGGSFAGVFDIYVVMATTAQAKRLGHLAQQLGERMTKALRDSIAQGLTYSGVDLQTAIDRRTVLYRSFQRLFERFDVILTPALSSPPKTVDAGGATNTRLFAEWAQALYPFNLTGHPAASVPCGLSSAGLPVGLQLIAPWYEEMRILKVAACLEQLLPWAGMRPPL